MTAALLALASLWLAWVLAHVALMAAVRQDGPHCNGFSVRIPPWVFRALGPDEVAAVYFHELGHLRRAHAWRNLALVCAFRRAGPEARWRQELEADDYAAERGYGMDMASALRKLGAEAQDNVRARRLEAAALAEGPRPAGDPAAREAAEDEEGEGDA